MLTPSFELFQDADFLIIVIKAPFTKVSETEIFIEESDFKFFSKPYFLRLNLPGNIVEDGRESADYDADKGTFTVRVPKEMAGEHFEGLDMLTKLLAPKGQKSAQQPIIEILGEKSAMPSELLPDDEDIDWCVEQVPFQEQTHSVEGCKYGFGCLRSGVFARLQSELCELIDVREPDTLTAEERRSQRLADEDSKFDDDHYLADLYQDEAIQHLLHLQPPWCDRWRKLSQGGKRKDIVIFTEEEKDKMRKLPNKEYLIESCHLQSVFFSLVDILFAYVYNYRLTEGDSNVESGWTICKLSASLSWLEVFSSLQDTVVTCFRRSLCFPLYRHWGLAETVKDDVCKILALGRRQVLKCLVDMQDILQDTDQRYVLNDLYITDYSVWIQTVSNDKLESLMSALKKVTITKSSVGLALDELEMAAKLTMEEEEEREVTGGVQKLSLKEKTGNSARDSDDDSTDSDDSDTESDDESTESDDECTQSDTGAESDIVGRRNGTEHNENTEREDKLATEVEKISKSARDLTVKSSKTDADDVVSDIIPETGNSEQNTQCSVTDQKEQVLSDADRDDVTNISLDKLKIK